MIEAFIQQMAKCWLPDWGILQGLLTPPCTSRNDLLMYDNTMPNWDRFDFSMALMCKAVAKNTPGLLTPPCTSGNHLRK